MAEVVIAKSAPSDVAADDDHFKTEAVMAKINKAALPADVAAYITQMESQVTTLAEQVVKSEEELDTLKAENEDLKAKTPETDADESDDATDDADEDETDSENAVEKSLASVLSKADPAIRAVIEKQQAQIAEAQAIAKAERDARLDREYLAKAAALNVPIEKSELAGMLRRIGEVLPEDEARVVKALEAMSAQVSSGDLFRTYGQTAPGSTPLSKSIATRAAEIRKGDPTLTIEQAEARALMENPQMASKIENGEDA